MLRADPRQESLPERDDRNLAELIQELRVVSLGVQVLFGFLLSLPFTVRFSHLGASQRDLYLASLVLSATATILLLGPVAYHRLVFRQDLKESLVRYANVMAILGLAAVGAAVLTAVLLVISFVAGLLPGVLITAVMACALASLWFVQPLIRRGSKLAACPRAAGAMKGGHVFDDFRRLRLRPRLEGSRESDARKPEPDSPVRDCHPHRFKFQMITVLLFCHECYADIVRVGWWPGGDRADDRLLL
jgi:hypothetical protein